MDPIETYTRRVRRFHGGKWNHEDRSFPREVPVTLYVNSSLLVTVSASPESLDDLAVGYLFTEGFLKSAQDVSSLSATADGKRGQVWVELRFPVKDPGTGFLTSGCGRATTFMCLSDLDAFTPLPLDSTFEPDEIRRAVELMLRDAVQHRNTGAIHAASCWRDGRILAMAEDIGRHNAVDKVLGAVLRSGLDPEGAALVTTGRISSEMALKAAVARVPLVASMRGATHMALEAASRLGVTVVTHVRGDRMDACTVPERLGPKIESGGKPTEEGEV